jgi:hypothetical protein
VEPTKRVCELRILKKDFFSSLLVPRLGESYDSRRFIEAAYIEKSPDLHGWPIPNSSGKGVIAPGKFSGYIRLLMDAVHTQHSLCNTGAALRHLPNTPAIGRHGFSRSNSGLLLASA